MINKVIVYEGVYLTLFFYYEEKILHKELPK